MPNPVTIDEIQRVPELTLAIKRSVDRNRQAGGFLERWLAGELEPETMAPTALTSA